MHHQSWIVCMKLLRLSKYVLSEGYLGWIEVRVCTVQEHRLDNRTTIQFLAAALSAPGGGVGMARLCIIQHNHGLWTITSFDKCQDLIRRQGAKFYFLPLGMHGHSTETLGFDVRMCIQWGFCVLCLCVWCFLILNQRNMSNMR